MNYYILIPVLLVIALFVIWLIRRNLKDERKIEGDQNPLQKNPKDVQEEI